MDIISQDTIKLGYSGGQGKIQIQTLLDHVAQLVQQLRLRRTSVENPLQIGLFLQNKANLRKSQMDVKLITTKDYEEKSNRTFGENKANLETEVRRQNTEKEACPFGKLRASSERSRRDGRREIMTYNRVYAGAKKVLTAIRCVLISSG